MGNIKRIICVGCLLLIFFNSSFAGFREIIFGRGIEFLKQADTVVVLTGRVYGIDQQPLDNVTVLLRGRDASILATNVSDSMGNFSVSATRHKIYGIELTRVGYGNFFKTLDSLKEPLSLGIIVLNKKVNELEEILIVGKKPFIERKMDRTIVNIENHIRQIGGNANDALKLAPGIKVANGSISLAGKGTIIVMINEKIIQLSGVELSQFLSTIPSEGIQSIEVLTNPPAKYDASGNTGYINIVLKKSRLQGYNGSISTSIGEATSAYGNFSGNFNFNTERLRLNVSPSFGFNGFTSSSDQRIRFSDLHWNQNVQTENENRSIGLNFNSIYDLSKRTSVEVLYNYSRSPNTGNSINNSEFVSSGSFLADSTQKTTTKFGSTTQSHIVDISTTTKLDSSGGKFSFDVNYFSRKQPSFRNFETSSSRSQNRPSSIFDRVTSENRRNIEVYTASADIVIPLKKFELSSGVKIIFIKSFNDARYSAISPLIEAQNSLFDYSENTESLYINLKRTGPELSLQVGLRGEYTHARGYLHNLNQENKYHIFQLFPTIFANYKHDGNNTFTATYGKRISRPGYSWVNPFRLYSSINSFQEGNPYLEPYYSHNFEFIHVYKDFLTTSMYYSATKNKFDQITIQERNDRGLFQGTVNRNFLSEKSLGITESFSFNQVSWFESTTEVHFYYNKIMSTDPVTPREIDGITAYLSTDNSVSFNDKKTFMANIAFWFQFPEVSGVDKVRRYYSFDLGVSGKIYKNRLSFAVNFTDIFKTGNASWTSLINNVPQYYYQYYDTRRFRVSLVYKFRHGKDKENKRTKRSDEWNRASY